LNISTDAPLLSDYNEENGCKLSLRRKLNPLQVFILAAKDVPPKTEPKYLPVYTL